jgi:hypothetical protein
MCVGMGERGVGAVQRPLQGLGESGRGKRVERGGQRIEHDPGVASGVGVVGGG